MKYSINVISRACFLFSTIFLPFSVSADSQTIQENAEDGDIVNWNIYDDDPTGAVITNVIDTQDSSNRVIQFNGLLTSNGYKYTLPSSSTSEFILQWRMKYSESYTVYISCQTTDDHRYLYYTAAAADSLGSDRYVHHGLGGKTCEGVWTIVRRNLLKDLHEAQPDCDIISVDAFLIRGSGYIDDIATLAYLDADHDLIPDELENSLGLDPGDPSDAAQDLDSDGLSNLEEVLYGTQLNNADSDSDSLTDYFEIFSTFTDPMDADSDNNGINDGAEDFDSDGLTNIQEQSAEMDPFDPAIQGNGYKYEQSIQEDAEDGDIVNWDVYDSDPEGADIANIIDPDNAANRVIHLNGTTTSNGYRYTFEPPGKVQFKIQWRMKYSESYIIYISCQTTQGHRYIYYTASGSNHLGNDRHVHHGLGGETKSGTWTTVMRDLQSDLHDAQPDCDIISVDAFLVRGSGLVDDIITQAYADADRDLLPDAIEIAMGLDPNDNDSDNNGIRDGDEDSDNDGLTNIQEWIAGTSITSNDSDLDGLTDFFEINRTHTNPLNADTDSNGTPDGQEDPDSDSYTNLQEQTAGTDPLDPASPGSGYTYEQTSQENSEDGDTAGWDIYDNSPEGASITNILNPNAPLDNPGLLGRVIQLTGDATSNGYRYTFESPEQVQFKIQWKMKYNESFIVYISCQTTQGHRYIYYTASSSDSLGSDRYVHHGIGANTKSGAWVTIRRDLLADLRDAQPDNNIISVDAFLIRGSGYIDDIATLAYLDADHDLIPDKLENSLGLDPDDSSDAALDLDSDGLSNLEEVLYGTTLNNADSDADVLTDYFEIFSTFTDPMDADSDDNGTNDGAEDFDTDGLTNIQEQSAKMDPFNPAIQGNGYKYEQSIQEDAEDGDTVNWDVYDNDPEDADIANIIDPDNAANRMIQFDGSATSNGYRYTFESPERTQFKIQWDMKYDESYVLYISCQTTSGHRYIYYTAAETDSLGTAGYVHHGLGADTKNGNWVTIRRDLQRDLWDAQPDCDIISVNAFLIRGSGFVDDIATFAYADADYDLLPDDVETAVGLDPDNVDTDDNGTDDPDEDMDGDTLSNLREIILGTDLDSVDSDSDGLTDDFEVNTSHTDPTNTDTDGDGMPDAWELDHNLNPLLNDASEDADMDGLSNLEEFQLNTDPNNADSDSDGRSDYEELYVYHTDPNTLDIFIVVNENKEYTKNRQININPLVFTAPQYAKIHISELPDLSNPNIIQNPGEVFQWNLPSNQEKTYFLYLQFFDSSDIPQGEIQSARVVLDTTAPVLEIINPVEGSTTDQVFVNLELTAFDPHLDNPTDPDSGKTITINVNDKSYTGKPDGTFTIKRFSVQGEGVNTIDISLEDKAGNITERTVQWTVDASGDTVAPVLSEINLTEDTDSGVGTGIITVPNVGKIWIQGNLDDPDAIVKFSVNGEDAGDFNIIKNPAGNFQFGGFVPLDSGINAVDIEASDLAGNSTDYSYSVNRREHIVQVTSHNISDFANGADQVIAGIITSQINGEPVVGVKINGVPVESANLIDNGDGTLTFSATVPTAEDGSITSINVTAETDSDKTSTACAIHLEGYEILYRWVKRHWSQQWVPTVYPAKTPDRWWLARNMLFGDVDIYQAKNKIQHIDYYAPNYSKWGTRVDDPDIPSSIIPLGAFWEMTGSGDYTISSGSTSGVTAELVANKGSSYFFQAGLWKFYRHSLEPSNRIQINYQKYSTHLKIKIPIYDNMKQGDKFSLLISFYELFYERFSDDPELKLDLVKFQNKKPIAIDGTTATYLIEAEAGGELEITNDSFKWPETYKTNNDPYYTKETKGRFRFDNFSKITPKVEIIPDDPIPSLQEVDDGDGNDETRVFIVPVKNADESPSLPDYVAMRAKLTPLMGEDDLPSGWTLVGGQGSNRLSRTVSRLSPSKTEFTFSYGGTDAGVRTTLYVYNAKITFYSARQSWNPIALDYSGHAWWGFSGGTQTRELLDITGNDKLKDDYLRMGGFFCLDFSRAIAGAPGEIRWDGNAQGEHYEMTSKSYNLTLTNLINGLIFVKNCDESPPTYMLYIQNCTDVAIQAGEHANKPTMSREGFTTPTNFYNWLNNN